MKQAKLYKVVEECITVSGDCLNFSHVNLPTSRIENRGDEAFHVDEKHVSTRVRDFSKVDTSWVDNKCIKTTETSYVILDPVLESYVEILIDEACRESRHEVKKLEGQVEVYKEVRDNCRRAAATAADNLCNYRNSFNEYHKEMVKVRMKDVIATLLVGVIVGALVF